jgi:fibronectin type 3 domain-containing protein
LLTPTDASTTTDLTPTFDWNDVSGATSYTIQVDNNSDFSSPEIQQSPTVSTYTPASNLAAGTYYWRVLATNANGSSAYSASWSVILNATVVPGVPANLVTSVVSGNIFINWDDAANATNYDVYSSANPYGTFAFLANVAVSEYTYVPGANTKMFFYIVSKNATKTETPDNIEVKAIKKRTIKEIKEGTSGN